MIESQKLMKQKYNNYSEFKTRILGRWQNVSLNHHPADKIPLDMIYKWCCNNIESSWCVRSRTNSFKSLGLAKGDELTTSEMEFMWRFSPTEQIKCKIDREDFYFENKKDAVKFKMIWGLCFIK